MNKKVVVNGIGCMKDKDLFIHTDIRPIQELDREFTYYIPWILKMSE